jgi:gas vesicle protein
MDRQNGLSYLLPALGIGAAGAILFAPQNGVEAKLHSAARAQEGTGYLKRQGGILLQQASETIEPLKEDLRKPLDALADAVAAGKRAYREAVQNPSRLGIPHA